MTNETDEMVEPVSPKEQGIRVELMLSIVYSLLCQLVLKATDLCRLFVPFLRSQLCRPERFHLFAFDPVDLSVDAVPLFSDGLRPLLDRLLRINRFIFPKQTHDRSEG